MRSPWEVLGLPPGSSQQEIRAAYARRLREHRPDVDPVGFRELRDAYEMLRAGPGGAAARWVPPPPASPPPPRRPAAAAKPTRGKPRRPPIGQRLRQALQRARRRGDDARELRLLRLLAQTWGRRPGHSGVEALLQQELASEASEAWLLLPPSAVLAAVAASACTVPLLLLRRQLLAGVAAPPPLVAALEAAAPSMPAAAVAELIRTAQAIALVDVGVAERFANAAFRNAHAGNMHELELRLQAGKEVRLRSSDDRRLLTRVLFDAGNPGAGDDERQRVVRMFGRLRGSAPVLRQLLLRQHPDLTTTVPLPKQRVRRAPRPTSRWRSTSAWRWWVIVMVISGIVRTCTAGRWLPSARTSPSNGGWYSEPAHPAANDGR